MVRLRGIIQSIGKGGKTAQVVVKLGAYRGTYHANWYGAAKVAGEPAAEWHTKPNRKTGEQFAIFTEPPSKP